MNLSKMRTITNNSCSTAAFNCSNREVQMFTNQPIVPDVVIINLKFNFSKVFMNMASTGSRDMRMVGNNNGNMSADSVVCQNNFIIAISVGSIMKLISGNMDRQRRISIEGLNVECMSRDRLC